MRQPEPEKPPNHERWIISYADFTTLLLATFVVMYAVSSINSSKFQEMAEAFSTAFIGRVVNPHDSGMAAAEKSPFSNMPSPVHVPIVTRQAQIKNLPIATIQEEPQRAQPQERSDQSSNPAQPGQSGQAPGALKPEAQNAGGPPGERETVIVEPSGPPVTLPELREQIEQRVQSLDLAFEKLKAALAPLIGTGQVRVSLQSLGVVVDINEVLLFNSGKAELTPQALPLIDKIAAILKGLPYQIQVNGFTDNKPIHNAQFDSNWDLSASRAISVVKRFVAAGVNPALLVGAGFGEYHPVAANTTPEGMAMNRRVSVVVVSPVRRESPQRTPLLGAPQGRMPAPAPAPPAEPAQP
jgi:chemotaxis protein MotB